MFLIRTAFWLTLIILLLPTNESQQRDVYGTAEAAVKDLGAFCTRNPHVCDKSKEAFDVFSQKAQFGAKMLMDFVTDSGDEVQTTADESRGRRFPSIFNRDSQNTLSNDDRRPAWSGPARDAGV